MSLTRNFRWNRTTQLMRAAFLVVFAVAIVLPFCTSFFTCAMACCHPTHRALQMTAPIGGCPLPNGGCNTQVSSKDDETNAVTAKAPSTTPRLAIVRVAVQAPPHIASTNLSVPQSASEDRALHLLNETFRI